MLSSSVVYVVATYIREVACQPKLTISLADLFEILLYVRIASIVNVFSNEPLPGDCVVSVEPSKRASNQCLLVGFYEKAMLTRHNIPANGSTRASMVHLSALLVD